MFIRKLFSSKNKLLWVLVDLLIVIIGVYCAFLIQQSAVRKRDEISQDRVLTALKYETETFRFTMSTISVAMARKYEEVQAIASKGSYSNFHDYRFIAPQYDYQAIEYALSLQNAVIVDFELNEALQNLWVSIKRIEHVESMLTETASNYRSIPQDLATNGVAYKLLWSENFDHHQRFVIFIKDRANTAQNVVNASISSLQIINERLGEEKRRQLEEELILKNIRMVVSSEDKAVEIGKIYYPDFTEEEIRELYRKAVEP